MLSDEEDATECKMNIRLKRLQKFYKTDLKAPENGKENQCGDQRSEGFHADDTSFKVPFKTIDNKLSYERKQHAYLTGNSYDGHVLQDKYSKEDEIVRNCLEIWKKKPWIFNDVYNKYLNSEESFWHGCGEGTEFSISLKYSSSDSELSNSYMESDHATDAAHLTFVKNACETDHELLVESETRNNTHGSDVAMVVKEDEVDLKYIADKLETEKETDGNETSEEVESEEVQEKQDVEIGEKHLEKDENAFVDQDEYLQLLPHISYESILEEPTKPILPHISYESILDEPTTPILPHVSCESILDEPTKPILPSSIFSTAWPLNVENHVTPANHSFDAAKLFGYNRFSVKCINPRSTYLQQTCGNILPSYESNTSFISSPDYMMLHQTSCLPSLTEEVPVSVYRKVCNRGIFSDLHLSVDLNIYKHSLPRKCESKDILLTEDWCFGELENPGYRYDCRIIQQGKINGRNGNLKGLETGYSCGSILVERTKDSLGDIHDLESRHDHTDLQMRKIKVSFKDVDVPANQYDYSKMALEKNEDTFIEVKELKIRCRHKNMKMKKIKNKNVQVQVQNPKFRQITGGRKTKNENYGLKLKLVNRGQQLSDKKVLNKAGQNRDSKNLENGIFKQLDWSQDADQSMSNDTRDKKDGISRQLDSDKYNLKRVVGDKIGGVSKHLNWNQRLSHRTTNKKERKGNKGLTRSKYKQMKDSNRNDDKQAGKYNLARPAGKETSGRRGIQDFPKTFFFKKGQSRGQTEDGKGYFLQDKRDPSIQITQVRAKIRSCAGSENGPSRGCAAGRSDGAPANSSHGDGKQSSGGRSGRQNSNRDDSNSDDAYNFNNNYNPQKSSSRDKIIFMGKMEKERDSADQSPHGTLHHGSLERTRSLLRPDDGRIAIPWRFPHQLKHLANSPPLSSSLLDLVDNPWQHKVEVNKSHIRARTNSSSLSQAGSPSLHASGHEINSCSSLNSQTVAAEITNIQHANVSMDRLCMTIGKATRKIPKNCRTFRSINLCLTHHIHDLTIAKCGSNRDATFDCCNVCLVLSQLFIQMSELRHHPVNACTPCAQLFNLMLQHCKGCIENGRPRSCYSEADLCYEICRASEWRVDKLIFNGNMQMSKMRMYCAKTFGSDEEAVPLMLSETAVPQAMGETEVSGYSDLPNSSLNFCTIKYRASPLSDADIPKRNFCADASLAGSGLSGIPAAAWVGSIRI